MAMKPLKQWVCDHCGQIIERPEDGWLEWLSDYGADRRAYGFKLVHHSDAAPDDEGCYQYDDHPHRSDMHLNHMTGDYLPALYSFLDIGPHHDPDGNHVPGVQNLREFVELLRRLTLPHYEEARLYFDAADADGFFNGMNEVALYLPETLLVPAIAEGRVVIQSGDEDDPCCDRDHAEHGGA